MSITSFSRRPITRRGWKRSSDSFRATRYALLVKFTTCSIAVLLLVGNRPGARWLVQYAVTKQAAADAHTTQSLVASGTTSSYKLQGDEPMRLQMDCTSCEKEFELTPANTLLFVFEQMSYCTFIEGNCGCGESSRVFVDDDVRDACLERGLPHVETQTPDKWVQEQYAKVFGQSATHELTPRMEEEVARLGELLANTPDDLLQDIFANAPPKSKLPQRWT